VDWETIERSIPMGIAAVDNEGRQIYVNDCFCFMTGWSREELLGERPPFNYWVPGERDSTHALFEVFRTSNHPVTGEMMMRSKDGITFPVRIVAAPLRDAAGKKTGIIGAVWDNTERRRIEKAFEESEERYRRLFLQSPDAIFVSVEGKIILVNDAGVRLFGAAKPEELLGKNLVELVTEDYRELARARWKVLMEERRPVMRTEIQICRLGGGLIHVESVHAPVHFRGEEAVQSVYRDITERKSAEEAFRAQQRQLRSLASKVSNTAEHERQRIAGNIHNGLGQSLSLIRMKLDMLLANERSHGRTSISVKEVRDFVDQAISSVHSIIHELSPPILHTMGLESALEWLADKVREDTGLTVSFEVDGAPPPLDEDSKSLLYHAAGELIHNAVKHAGAGRVRVTLREKGDLAELVVEDDGAGFDPAQALNRISDTGGFGLFNIGIRCEQAGGSISIDSSPGRGTRIVLTLPVSKPAAGGP
jgi:PAS domain S-box-containing protein